MLTKLINEVYRDEIAGSKARDIGYLIKLFLEAEEMGDLEERVSSLEVQLDEFQKQNEKIRA